MKKIFWIVGILVFILIAGFIAVEITKYQIKRITQRETERITKEIVGEETERITQEEIDRITKERTREITNQILGVTEQPEEAECKLTPKQREFSYGQYYKGPLIDTHVHMPVASKIVSDIAIQAGFEDMPFRGDITTDYIVCLFDSEGITKTFGFFIIPNVVLDSSVNILKKDMGRHPGKFAAFFMPPLPLQSLMPEVSAVEKAFKNNPGLFQGYGEARFDFNLGDNAHPEDEYFLEMYRLSGEHNLIVQIHPNKGQLAALEHLLKKYPDVVFLAHVMPDSRNEIGKLMETHKNLYYSLDAEIHYIFGYQTIQNNKGPTKEEYLKFIRENFDSVLKEALDNWKSLIEAHPDQFTWGTDRWYTWHFDYEVGGLVVEFGRTFIGHLKPEVQEKFAYKNAETMLKNR